MKQTPLDTAKTVMSGKTTAQRIAAAEQAAVSTKPRQKAKPAVAQASAPLPKPQQKHVDARQRAIEAQQAADRAAIIELNKRNSLRNMRK